VTEPTQSLQDAIFTRLDAIAAKLGVAAGHIWPVLVRQATVDGVRDLITAGVLGVGAFYLAKLARYLNNKEDWLDDFAIIMSAISALILAGVSIIYLCSSVGELINPEYYAFSGLKDLFK
jgi:hypothetical protein